MSIQVFNKKKERILFVSHELTYSGAPNSLLQMCRAANRIGFQFDIWSRLDGEFKKEFEKCGFRVKIVSENDLRSDWITDVVKSYDFALCNTIATEKYVALMGPVYKSPI